MATVTMPPREHLHLKQKQEEIISELSFAVKRLEPQSQLLDQGKGKVFSNPKEFDKYLRAL